MLPRARRWDAYQRRPQADADPIGWGEVECVEDLGAPQGPSRQQDARAFVDGAQAVPLIASLRRAEPPVAQRLVDGSHHGPVVAPRDEVDRRAQQRALDDRAPLERPGERIPLEAGDAGPEPDVARRRVLVLQEAHPFQGPGDRDRGAFQQHLPCEQGAVELAFGQDPRGRHPASLGGARLKLPHLASRMSGPRGRGSVVEHHLAKVGVAGSNPVVRSKSEGVSHHGAHRSSRKVRRADRPEGSFRGWIAERALGDHDRDQQVIAHE